MTGQRRGVLVAIGVCCAMEGLCSGRNVESGEADRVPFERKMADLQSQDMARVQEVKASLAKGAENDLLKYREFADKILTKWKEADEEFCALLTQELCEPLSAGRFGSDGQYEVARELALAALKDAEAIPVIVETRLVKHVSAMKLQSAAKSQEEFAKRRLEDARVRLHAWNRLMSTLDPDWDPNQQIAVHPTPPPGISSFGSGAEPESIADPVVRAQYEETLREHRRKIEKYTEQHMLRNRMKVFPKEVEAYLIRIYSQSPSNLSELEKLLDRYRIGHDATERIIEAVARAHYVRIFR